MFGEIAILCSLFPLFGGNPSDADAKIPKSVSGSVISNAEAPRDHVGAQPDGTDREKGSPGDKVDRLAAARDAEKSFHAACDEWSAAHAKGKDTSAAAAKIASSYFDFMKHILKTKYFPNAAILVSPDPKQIASAGTIQSENGSTQSYVISKDQGGLSISVWRRAAWKDPPGGLPAHGFAARFDIEPHELSSKFTLGKADWTDADQKILRVPYTLGDIRGVIEICRDDDHYPWPIHPDRGVMKGNLWLPFPKE